MGAISPLAYFLQTIAPPSPASTKSTIAYDSEKLGIDETFTEKGQEQHLESQPEQIKLEDDTIQRKEPQDIKAALKEALTSPTFLMITLGFSVCGFHVTFLATHFPAYLVNRITFSMPSAWSLTAPL